MPLDWTIAGIGDVDGDEKADLVWRNTSTGDVAVWLGNGVDPPTTTGVIAGSVPLPSRPRGLGIGVWGRKCNTILFGMERIKKPMTPNSMGPKTQKNVPPSRRVA